MAARIFLAVFAIMLGAAQADAGVMISPHVAADQPSDAAVLKVLSEIAFPADSEVPQCHLFDGGTDDFAAGALNSAQSLGSYAWLGDGWEFAPPQVRWRLSLANAVLPSSPVLDGLLKPS